MSLKNWIQGAEGAIGGFLTGGPTGAVAGGIRGFNGVTTQRGAPSSVPGRGSGGGLGGFNMPFPVNGPGGIPLPGFNPGGGNNGQAPRGYHLNKHALAASKKHGAVAARTIWVRNRHVNPLNPRALKRALRREKSAGKIIRRLHVFRPTHTTHRRIGRGTK